MLLYQILSGVIKVALNDTTPYMGRNLVVIVSLFTFFLRCVRATAYACIKNVLTLEAFLEKLINERENE